MPRYHFNLTDHIYEPDPEGTELPDPHTARVQAVMFAGACLRDTPSLLDEGEFGVIVTDDTGTKLFNVMVRTEDYPV